MVEGAHGCRRRGARGRHALAADGQSSYHHVARRPGIVRGVRNTDQVRAEGLDLEVFRDRIERGAVIRLRLDRRSEGGLSDDVAEKALRLQELVQKIRLL